MTGFAEALALFQRGDLPAAEAALTALLARDPAHLDSLQLYASVRHARGELAGALELFERAAELVPDNPQIAFNRAMTLAALGRHAEAVDGFAGTLTLQPNDQEALLAQAASLTALGRHGEALTRYETAHGFGRDDANLHALRGAALLALERWADAVEALDRALVKAPDHILARAARGTALANVGRFDDALADIDFALARHPERIDLWRRRGFVLTAANRGGEAIGAYQRVLTAQPHDAQAAYAIADALLADGEFERGWRMFESRLRLPNVPPRPPTQAPRWTGQEDLTGRSILVQGELGFGDLIQFCRFVPELARRGARVIVQERLQTLALLRSLGGVAELVSQDAPAPVTDFSVPMASLMLALELGADAIPAPIPYLHADAARAARWREKLGPRSKRRIGVCWVGGMQQAMQRWRRLDGASLERLLGADAEFVSLQMEAGAEKPIVQARGVRSFGRDTADFAELAALIQNLDLVISVDTGAAHLAGALGKQVWVLLPFYADWRWMRERSDTPWYPQARLFRQQRFNDWSSVIDDVLAALQ